MTQKSQINPMNINEILASPHHRENVLLEIIDGYIAVSKRLNLSDVFDILLQSIETENTVEASQIRACIAFHKGALAHEDGDSLEDILVG